MKKEYQYVFFLSIDALRFSTIYDTKRKSVRSIFPFFKKISQDSLFFINTFSNGPGTPQSFPSIMASKYFLMNNGYYLNKKFNTVAELASRLGYYTVGLNSNPYLSKKFGWNRGFIEYYDIFENVNLKPTKSLKEREKEHLNFLKILKLRVKKLFNQRHVIKLRKEIRSLYSTFFLPYIDGSRLIKIASNKILEKKREKIFMWFHLMDTHYPYAPPKKFLPIGFKSRTDALKYNYKIDTKSPSIKDTLTLHKLYIGEVKYVDYLIKNFFDFLDENNLLKKSLIFIFSDHGEGFKEHGFLLHRHDKLYNELIRVPLIIFDNLNQEVIELPVSLIDILPTFVQYVAKNTTSNLLRKIYGKNLLYSMDNKKFNIFNERIIFVDSADLDPNNFTVYYNKYVVSAVKYPYKLIVNRINNTVELFDLSNDKNERDNLIDGFRYKKILKELRKAIEKHVLESKMIRRLRVIQKN